ncbi:MAG: FumA C-terminus/TtdB family hydratase beta subunit [Candidatus Bathyarchaeia archaeon]
MAKEVRLETPLNEGDARALRVGDVVYLTGTIYQIRLGGHLKALECAEKGQRPPFDLEGSVIYHAFSSIVRTDAEWRLNYIGATTSALLNKYEPPLIRKFKVRGIVGKGGMDGATLEAMKEVGCVYLAQVGGASALYTSRIERVQAAHWEELGAERVFALKVKDFGPLHVGMDAHGNSLYESVNSIVKSKLPEIYKALKITV